MSHRAWRRATGEEFGDKKMAPKIGAIRQKYNFDRRSQTKVVIAGTLDSQDSETEMREVAVANRDPRARHQQAVDGGHQPAEQGGRGYEADGSSLGHWCPLLWMAEELRF